MKWIYRTTRLAVSAVLGLGLALACSSQPKPVTGLDQVQNNRVALDDTHTKLKKAQKELSQVQGTVADLRKEFLKSNDIATRERAGRSLDGLSSSLEQARLDIEKQLVQNRREATDLDSRLRQAAQANRRIMTGDDQLSTRDETP